MLMGFAMATYKWLELKGRSLAHFINHCCIWGVQ